jgi:hypothetical protein
MNEVFTSMPHSAKQSDCPLVRRKLLIPRGAAALLQMDHRTLIRSARAGYVPAHPPGERRRRAWRFFEEDVLLRVAS